MARNSMFVLSTVGQQTMPVSHVLEVDSNQYDRQAGQFIQTWQKQAPEAR